MSLRERIAAGLADRYEIGEEIGSGGMAIVFRALDIKHERNVAIKVLRPEIGLAIGTERFLQEIKTTAQLSHPNILSLIDSGNVDELLYYVMPLVEGETLRSRLSRDGQLSYEDALEIIKEIADALSYAHSRDILHRDIKPENIMLERGHAIVADFGISRAMSTAGMARITQTGMVIGTPAYMSPEQAGGDQNLDVRSDVYSLAAVFFEMLVGAAPFEAPTPQGVIVRQLSEEVPLISKERAGVPPVVDYSVRKALAKSPADRYSTVEQFLDSLQKTELSTAATVELRRFKKTSKKRSKWTVLTVLAAVMAAFSLGSVAALYSSGSVDFDKRDWILIADFENHTGDSIFDESLNTALAVGVQQSRHVNVFPSTRVAETLRRMERSDVSVIDQSIGMEVALRENLKVLVIPSIVQVDSVYNLATRIVDPATGEDIKSRSVRASGRSEVLPALDKLSRRLRRDLGESMFAVSQRRVELAAATTPSLEALRAWSEGGLYFGQRRYDEARDLFERALELDSNFAMAHTDLGAFFYYHNDRPSGDPHFERALALSDRVTERERLWIQAEIHNWRQEREQAVEAYNVFLGRYPDDLDAWFRLGYALMRMNRLDEAETAFEQVLSLDSLNAAAFINLATVLNNSGRHAEATGRYHRAFEINPGWLVSGNLNHEFGFNLVKMGEIDSAAAVFNLMLSESEAQKAQGRRSLGLLALYRGKYRDGIEHLRLSANTYRTAGTRVSELRSRVFLAEAYQAVASETELQVQLVRIRELAQNPSIQPLWLCYAGKVHARSGLISEARMLLDSAASRENAANPSDRSAVANLRGEVAMAEGRHEEAIEQFEAAHTLTSTNYHLESLAHAHFVSGDLDNAESSFREIADQKTLGWEAQAPWILSFYYLGRVLEEKGDSASAATYYSQFMDIWNDGDEDLLALADARERVAQLVVER